MEENKCQNPAAYRYTWPGKNESFVCQEHAEKLLSVANAMGMFLQVIPLDFWEVEKAGKCRQMTAKVTKEHEG